MLIFKSLIFLNKAEDNTTDVTDVWVSISDFTSGDSLYYGHEIFDILDLVTTLLDRQEMEMNSTADEASYLRLQINASFYGAEKMDNLISNDVQWDQLINVIFTANLTAT